MSAAAERVQDLRDSVRTGSTLRLLRSAVGRLLCAATVRVHLLVLCGQERLQALRIGGFQLRVRLMGYQRVNVGDDLLQVGQGLVGYRVCCSVTLEVEAA